MPSIIRATTTSGLQVAPDNSGSLELQTNGTTPAVTIDTSQRAAFVAGTAALPAITTAGDTNTGIFFPAADTIAFAEGGTESMRLDSSGNVGIGTSSPSTYASATRKVLSINNIDNVLTLGSYYELGIAQYSFINSSNAAGSVNIDLVFSTGSNTERMRITSSGNLLFNSGYGSAATAYGCRAWVNFNGTGVVAIRGSGNVTSITDNGTGTYTVNFTTAMPDANYSWSGLAGSPGVTNGYQIIGTPLAASVPITTLNTALALFDPTYVTVMVMR